MEITAQHRPGGDAFSVRNGSDWSIGTTDGNARRIPGGTPPFQGAELRKRIAGGTLYVDAYTDIEAPREVTTGGTYDFTFPGINVGGQFTQQGGSTNLPAVLDGVSGRATCTGCSFVYTTGQLRMTGGTDTARRSGDRRQRRAWMRLGWIEFACRVLTEKPQGRSELAVV